MLLTNHQANASYHVIVAIRLYVDGPPPPNFFCVHVPIVIYSSPVVNATYNKLQQYQTSTCQQTVSQCFENEVHGVFHNYQRNMAHD